MGIIDKELAEEIVRLEKLRADGQSFYTVTETVEKQVPIRPRLLELYEQMEATGLGPKHTTFKP